VLRNSICAAALSAACALALGCSVVTSAIRPKGDAAMLKELREMQAERLTAEQAPSKPPRESSESHLREGDQLRRSGDYARALWAYLRAHQLDRKDPRPLSRIGSIELAIEPKGAERLFRDLVASTQGSPIARTGLGLALIARGEWAAAGEQLSQAVAADDGLAVAHDALGLALERQGHTEAAREHYRTAARLQPASYEPLNNLGVSYLRTGEFPAAVEALEEASRREPRDPAVANNLGLALGRLGRYDEAEQAFRRAGSEQAVHNNLGFVHYLNGDYEGALAAYEKALLAPGDPQQRLAVLRNARAARRAEAAPDVATTP
jgi:Flp pilus assembly protein TadD